MKIIRATEAITIDHPVFMIFGQPGICKTSLAYSTEAPLLLDFDKGAHRAANRRDTLQIDTWADVEELMTDAATLQKYRTLIPDTVGRCLDVLTAHLAAKDPKKFPGGAPGLQGWGVLRTQFRAWISSLRALGLDVLLVSHDKEDKDGDTRVVRPDIQGGSYAEVMKVADFVGYLYMSGKDRVLDFSPTDRWIGKNPAQWAPFKVPPVGKAQAFMANLFQQGRDALGHLSEESAAIVRQVETWREKIAKLETPQQFTDQGPLIATLEPIVKPQVAKILIEASVTKGFTFDRGTKTFSAPAPEPAGTAA